MNLSSLSVEELQSREVELRGQLSDTYLRLGNVLTKKGLRGILVNKDGEDDEEEDDDGDEEQEDKNPAYEQDWRDIILGVEYYIKGGHFALARSAIFAAEQGLDVMINNETWVEEGADCSYSVSGQFRRLRQILAKKDPNGAPQ